MASPFPWELPADNQATQRRNSRQFTPRRRRTKGPACYRGAAQRSRATPRKVIGNGDSGKTAIVTGAIFGIGLGIATALAEAGANVVSLLRATRFAGHSLFCEPCSATQGMSCEARNAKQGLS
jgi:hypothetical protein